LNLRARMMLLVVLPVTLVAVLLTAMFLWHATDSLEQGLRTRGTAIARQMASAAEYGIFSGQRGTLQALADSALQIDLDARGVAVVDPQGTVLARSGDVSPQSWPPLGRIGGHRIGSDVLLFAEPVTRTSLPVDDIYIGAEAAATPSPKVVGHVVVELSRREVDSKSARLIAIGFLIAGLGTVIGGWLAQRIARTVTRPLLQASEVVERIGRGDLQARMATDSAGALKSLAEGINDMARRLGVTQEELRILVADATLDLLREKEAAEHATIAKSHFLSAASHDLRQPLHALGLFVARLSQSDAAREEPRLVAHIQLAVDTLQNLLDAILDISRLDEGKVVPQIADFPLGMLFDRLGDDLSLLAEQHDLKLKLRPTQAWVRSDRKIVARILLNLVGNALRYTHAGGVLVSCRRRPGVVRVEVWDTGVGIPDHAREAIFEEYVQLGNPERDQAKGLGLGLAICRRLADLLAIPIGVRSRLGRGTVFWIDLPLSTDPVPDAMPADDSLPIRHAGDHARIFGTVLVVESEPLVRAGMEQAILSWGGRVLLAANADEALRRCRESALLPDLAICSVRLPGRGGGIQLAKDLQREFGPLGILLVSADVSPEIQEAATAAGFPLLREPVPPGRLRAALQHLLSLNR